MDWSLYLKLLTSHFGAGHSGMEAAFINLLEPGDEVMVLENGIWGQRAASLSDRMGFQTHKVTNEPGVAFSLDQIEKVSSWVTGGFSFLVCEYYVEAQLRCDSAPLRFHCVFISHWHGSRKQNGVSNPTYFCFVFLIFSFTFPGSGPTQAHSSVRVPWWIVLRCSTATGGHRWIVPQVRNPPGCGHRGQFVCRTVPCWRYEGWGLQVFSLWFGWLKIELLMHIALLFEDFV